MKKIVMCVPDDSVGAILGLVGDLVTELSVTTIEGSTKAPATKRVSKGASPIEQTGAGRLLLSQLPEDGTQVLNVGIVELFEKEGYSVNTYGPTVSKMVARKLIRKVGRDHIARVVS